MSSFKVDDDWRNIIDDNETIDLQGELIELFHDNVQASIDRAFLLGVHKMEGKQVTVEQLKRNSEHIVFQEETPKRHQLMYRGAILVEWQENTKFDDGYINRSFETVVDPKSKAPEEVNKWIRSIKDKLG
jgi:hypothetical protein